MNLYYLIVLAVSLLVSSSVAVWVYSKRELYSASTLCFLLSLVSLWSFTSIAEFIASDLQIKYIIIKFAYLSYVLIGPTLLLFFIKYTNKYRNLINNKRIILYYTPSILIILYVWINPGRTFHQSVSVIEINGSTLFYAVYGPAFWCFVIFNIVVILASMAILTGAKKDKIINLKQFCLLLAAMIFPMLVDLLYILRVTRFEWTSGAYLISCILLTYAFNSQFLYDLPPTRAAMFELIDQGIIIFNKQKQIIDINRALYSILNIEPKKNFDIMREELHKYPIFDKNDIPVENSIFEITVDNQIRRIACHKTAHKVSGHGGSCALLFKDITDLYIMKKELDYAKNFDHITGLPIAANFLNALERQIRKPDKNGYAVLYLDIDNFGEFNRILGRDGADLILKEFGRRIAGQLNENNFATRLNSDEFCVLLTNSTLIKSEIKDIIKCLHEVMSSPFIIEDKSISLTFSAGIMHLNNTSESAQSVIKNLKAAAHKVKEKGGNGYMFVTDELLKNSEEHALLMTDIRFAADKGELVLLYQPQIDIRSNTVRGTEVLLRWNHPKLGCLLPERFIGIAEESGEIIKIGKWVIDTAFHEFAGWIDKGIGRGFLCINVSNLQFRDPDFAEYVLNRAEAHGIPYELIELELTESVAMQENKVVNMHFNRLHNAGIRFAIDDFGTEYNSLRYLKELPVNTLKVDKMFSIDVHKTGISAMIVEMLADISKQLEIDMVVEYIETEEQFAKLKSLGCLIFQGYYFSKPLSPGDMYKLWKNMSC